MFTGFHLSQMFVIIIIVSIDTEVSRRKQIECIGLTGTLLIQIQNSGVKLSDHTLIMERVKKLVTIIEHQKENSFKLLQWFQYRFLQMLIIFNLRLSLFKVNQGLLLFKFNQEQSLFNQSLLQLFISLGITNRS